MFTGNRLRLTCAILLTAVLAMQAYTLLSLSKNHTEAIERHAALTKLELENQQQFTSYIRETVDRWEKVQDQRNKENAKP